MVRIKNKLNALYNSLITKIETFRVRNYKKKAKIAFNEDWFKGKRVAIIGGADSAYKEHLGEFIESYDIVVRLNNGVRLIDKYKECIGTRTDFLFHSFYVENDSGKSPIETELWRKHNVGHLIFPHNMESEGYGRRYGNKFLESTKGNYPFSDCPEDICKMMRDVFFPISPTTGAKAIFAIMDCAPKELYITGITFFKTAHNQDYRSGSLDYWKDQFHQTNSFHNPEKEYSCFKELYLKHKSVFKLDSTLQAIIDQDLSS
ncbi:glycosyltransferase family 29 protein [Sphingobacterium sp. Mn56C]